MKYKTIELDKKGRMKICERCQNEDTLDYGNYCVVCGASLLNMCLGGWVENGDESLRRGSCEESREHPLPGNARFCPYCGQDTSFQKDEILLPWKKDRQEQENVLAFNSLFKNEREDGIALDDSEDPPF
ncbi:MAG: hypothetical protein RSE54_04015 [Ruthenibacterium sp.]